MASCVSTLWYVDAPDPATVLREFQPDCDAAQALLGRLYPDHRSTPLARVPLTEAVRGEDPTGPQRVFVGSYPGVTVVCAGGFSLRTPSALPPQWRQTPASEHTFLVVSDAPGAWGAFAAWECGTLRRAFGANTVEFFEDEGVPFEWERPYWAGEHPIRWPVDITPPPQSLPFHPRKLVEEANAAWLGFRYVGRPAHEPDPTDIEVWGFEVHGPGEPAPDPAPTPPSSWWRRVTRL